jgi:hypothetical protein
MGGGIGYSMDQDVSTGMTRILSARTLKDSSMITRETRYSAIKRLIAEYTEEHTRTPEAARAALIREGTYTADGELMPEFGGPRAEKIARGQKQ